MSRTKHHRNQKHARLGLDYGARYKYNQHYGGGYGPPAKHGAKRERRRDGKLLINQEMKCYETDKKSGTMA